MDKETERLKAVLEGVEPIAVTESASALSAELRALREKEGL